MNISLEKIDSLPIAGIKAALSGVLGAPVVSIGKFPGGLNSRVYRVTDSRSRHYVAKFYFRHPADTRNRLDVEFSCLKFLWKEGFRCVPRPIAAEPKRAFALYEYIDGDRMTSQKVTTREVETAVHFLTDLKKLTGEGESRLFPPASEACFSARAAVLNIQSRVERLFRSKETGEVPDALRLFLREEFLPLLEVLTAWCRGKLGDSGLTFEKELALEERTLSPSDFGFHNAIMKRDGRIVFFDFEYFGWDDPAKMISDFLLHPAMALDDSLKRHFVTCMVRSFKEFKGLEQRVEAVYPLFGLKWCLIFLNEFVSEDLLRRGFAKEDAFDRSQVQGEQLTKAKRLFETVKQAYRHFPYHG